MTCSPPSWLTPPLQLDPKGTPTKLRLISRNKSPPKIPTLISGSTLSDVVFFLFFLRPVTHHCSNSPSFVHTENMCTVNKAETGIENRCGHAVSAWHEFWEQLESMEGSGDAENLGSRRSLVNKVIRAWASKWLSPLKIVSYPLNSRHATPNDFKLFAKTKLNFQGKIFLSLRRIRKMYSEP